MSPDESLLRLLTITIIMGLGVYSLPRRQRRPQQAQNERERSEARNAFLEAENRLKAEIKQVGKDKPAEAESEASSPTE